MLTIYRSKMSFQIIYFRYFYIKVANPNDLFHDQHPAKQENGAGQGDEADQENVAETRDEEGQEDEAGQGDAVFTNSSILTEVKI